MIRNPGSKELPGSDIDHIFQQAQGILVELDATITTQAQGLKLLPRHGDEGFFSTTVFKNLNGSIVKYTVTTV